MTRIVHLPNRTSRSKLDDNAGSLTGEPRQRRRHGSLFAQRQRLALIHEKDIGSGNHVPDIWTPGFGRIAIGIERLSSPYRGIAKQPRKTQIKSMLQKIRSQMQMGGTVQRVLRKVFITEFGNGSQKGRQ